MPNEIKEEWTYRGKRCKITKHPEIGHYCGYMQTGLRGDIMVVNRLHDLIDVNGGVTYGIDENGWLGFDCAHHLDMCLDENGEPVKDYVIDRDDAVVWTVADVKNEVEDLVDQMIALEKTVDRLQV